MTMAKQVLVQGGTEARIERGLTVAVGNFWEGLYCDPEGRRINGMTAGLWIGDGGSREPQLVRVHPGKRLETASHLLEVVEVRADGRSFVRLDVVAR